MKLATTLAAVSLAGSIVAQAPELTLPKALTNAWGNGLAVYDAARDGTRTHQCWIRGDQLRSRFVIREIGERHDQGASDAMTLKLTYVIDNSSVTWATMDPDPTKNLSTSATTVFDASVNLPAVSAGLTPNQAHFWAKFTRPFVFTGPNILVQKTWTPPANTTGRRRFDASNANPRANFNAGKSCGGQLRCSYDTTTGRYSMALTQAPASSLVLFMLGVENVALGALKFPIDLTGSGMKGCELGMWPLVLLPTQADATGNATLTFPFTLPTTDAVTWSVQAIHQSTNTSNGWATTNSVNSILGMTGLMRNLRVDNRGTKGPDTWNATGPIFMLRGV